MILKDLFGKIGFEVDEHKLEGVEKRLDHIKELLEAFAAAEVVKGIAEMTEKFGEMAEQIHISSAAAGVTVEAFQKMAFSAQQAGVSQDELGAAMGRLARSVYMAKTGSVEAQLAFKRMGIDAVQVMGFRNAEDAMRAVADGVKRAGGGFEALGPLMQLTGRNSRGMVEWLGRGSEAMGAAGERAEKLGAVLTETQVEALTKAMHAAMAFSAVLKTLAATIASYFAPSVETAIEEFLKFYQVNKDLIQLEVRKWVWDITFALGFVWGAVKFVTQGFLDFAKSHELLVRRAGEVLFILGALVSTIFLLQKAFAVAGIVMGPFLSILKGVWGVVGLLRGGFAMLLEVIGYLTKAEWLLNAAILVTEAPLWAIVAAVAALILGGQALWKVLTGGSFKDTWIGQMVGWVSNLGIIQKALGGVKGLFAGGASDTVANFAANVGSIPGLMGASPGNVPTPGAAAAAAAGGGASINAPLTIQAAPGMNEKQLAAFAADKHKEHLDRTMREASRSLRPSLAY